jgi:hypothetical protein
LEKDAVVNKEPVSVDPPPPPFKANEAVNAYEALTAFKTYEEVVAVPCKDPVNPAVATMLPVICTTEPEAKIKFDLALSAVPLPTIKALCADDDILY